ncbi:unnamed protein product [Toxocara canis]|uniref:Sortilin-Vps10 domain-containing protein n=1 Tax=Toxocara canis TaxID=6265 RepID=A0A183VF36_TOXCA|nr:unnamed protein product [Toxocara canis]
MLHDDAWGSKNFENVNEQLQFSALITLFVCDEGAAIARFNTKDEPFAEQHQHSLVYIAHRVERRNFSERRTLISFAYNGVCWSDQSEWRVSENNALHVSMEYAHTATSLWVVPFNIITSNNNNAVEAIFNSSNIESFAIAMAAPATK